MSEVPKEAEVEWERRAALPRWLVWLCLLVAVGGLVVTILEGLSGV